MPFDSLERLSAEDFVSHILEYFENNFSKNIKNIEENIVKSL
jgi:hypothetical protein